MKDRFDKTLLKKIENIFYFLRLCNSTYNKHTYGFLTYISYIIAAACWYFFFFFAQLVVTLPHFFFQKMLPIQYILFPIYQAYFWLLLKKKEAFYVCRLCFQGFHEKKIMLWILKMLKTKTKSSKIKVRFGILRAIF